MQHMGSMTERFARTATLCAWLALAATMAAAGPGTATAPAPAAHSDTMPMDLTTGKTSNAPLFQEPGPGATGPITENPYLPETPPQTVEGTVVSVAPDGSAATIRTRRDGDIAVGLPPNVPVTRGGKDSAIGDIKPGDRIWATVVIEGGNRAIRIVTAPPTNPMVSYIGIPVLLLIALGIWWTGRGYSPPIEPKKATPRKA